MIKLNVKRIMFTSITMALLSPLMFSFQNFKHFDVPIDINKDDTGLNDALIAALKTAAEKRKAKRLALNSDLENEIHRKKNRKPTTDDVKHDLDKQDQRKENP